MNSRPWILGISCSHNGSACLLHGDEVVAAVQDERLVRVKRQLTLPRSARHCVAYCLEAGGIRARDLDLIVYAPVRGRRPEELEDIYLNELLNIGSARVPVVSISHHYAHAMSVYAQSGNRAAAVLVIDGSGSRFDTLSMEEQGAVINGPAEDDSLEWLSYYDADDLALTPIEKQVVRPNLGPGAFGSIGNMYATVGHRVFGSWFDGPGKVMGLAPYGRPLSPVDDWLTVHGDGVVTFSSAGYMRVQAECSWPDKFENCANLAADVQQAIEHALIEIVSHIRKRSPHKRLCYAGGVALNSVANEHIVRHGRFDDVFICPAADDAGVAIGAAYHGLWSLTGANTTRRLQRDAPGRTYSAAEIEEACASTPGLVVQATSDDMPERVSSMLVDGQLVGWFEGGAELGPRSLGQRSILCDPRPAILKDTLNNRVKRRESFRPFAPIVLREHATAWFDVTEDIADSPFMLRVWRFRDGLEKRVPAVAHVDGTARVQTITSNTHPMLYSVIDAFYRKTGVPMLLNTSFNVAGEPIVETPQDALWCLLCAGIDYCVLEDRIVGRSKAFDSVLALHPITVARSITIDIPINGGRLYGPRSAPTRAPDRIAFMSLQHFDWSAQMRRQGQDPLLVAFGTIDRRWGETKVLLTEEYVRLLEMIDGEKTGYELLRANEQWTEAWLADALRRLCVASVIRLQ